MIDIVEDGNSEDKGNNRNRVILEFGLHDCVNKESVIRLVDALVECREEKGILFNTCKELREELEWAGEIIREFHRDLI